jgi:hypothetical protein
VYEEAIIVPHILNHSSRIKAALHHPPEEVSTEKKTRTKVP